MCSRGQRKKNTSWKFIYNSSTKINIIKTAPLTSSTKTLISAIDCSPLRCLFSPLFERRRSKLFPPIGRTPTSGTKIKVTRKKKHDVVIYDGFCCFQTDCLPVSLPPILFPSTISLTQFEPNLSSWKSALFESVCRDNSQLCLLSWAMLRGSPIQLLRAFRSGRQVQKDAA